MDISLPGVSSDRAIAAEDPEVTSQADEEVDSMSTGWTDEKHSLYLNSMEASFVNQLYSSEPHSKGLLGWASRMQRLTSSPRSSPNSQVSGQFKVQRLGCWGKLQFERAKSRVDIENQSRLLSANPWIRHFRSPSIGKEPHITNSNKGKEGHITSPDQMDDNELVSQSIHLASMRHGREATSSKQLPACGCQLYRQDSVSSNTEVSDQNFVDEFEGGEQSRRTCCKKRVRTAVADSPVKDQVVPSGRSLVEPISDERRGCLKEKDTECSSRKPEGTAGFPYSESEPSFFEDQQLDSGLNAE